MLYKRIWWPPALWVVLTIATVYSGAPFHNSAGAVIEKFSQFFYNDPRRLTAVVTMLVTPMAAIALFAAVLLAVAIAKRVTDRFKELPPRVWVSTTAVLLVFSTVFIARHYLYRHLVLFGDKYDSVMIDQRDLMAMAYLSKLPGAHDTLIGNANTDGTAWMYAVADLHPLWTHYDFPQQTGPGPERYIFNTAIARCMELVNALYKYVADESKLSSAQGKEVLTFAVKNLLLLMAPMAPHISEELWHQCGFASSLQESIHVHAWPTFDDKLTIDDQIELVLQVNGKIVSKIAAQRGLTREAAEALALADDKVQAKMNGSVVRKVIVVPDKLVNIVV
ncbi:MAG: hypothetical protein B7W97_00735 [Mycobacterium sp. 20-66-4]|nr:MAG: hypothetical protein B7W97_00735 [Mycobacterium sp. 20-66-4]